MPNRQIILYIAMSLDGYIATEGGNLDFLSLVAAPPEDYGYAEFIKTIDTVVMGRKTYDKVLSFGIEFPHKEKKCYVISTTKTGHDDNVEFYNGHPSELISQLRQQGGKDIFIDGGAEVIAELLKSNQIDKFIISIIPVLLGSGIPLFKPGFTETNLKFIQSFSFPSGLIQLWYQRQ